MKPGDHPEFFRFPPPDGRSRESTIRLDAEGRFWHDGEIVEHPGMARAFARWISRHPDDGRYILSNGYDWTYFSVEDAPYFVRSLVTRVTPPEVELSDDTREPLDLASLRVGARGALYVDVKAGAYFARFTPQAQTEIAPLLVAGPSGEVAVEVAGARRVLAGPDD